MIRVKSRFSYLTLEAITFVLVLGALSMIWPAIIALFLGVLMLLQLLTAEPEVVLLVSLAEIDNISVVIASIRRPGLPAFVA